MTRETATRKRGLHPKLIDRTGQVFGSLVAIEYIPAPKGQSRWKCRCVCGAETLVSPANLQSGRVRSCGCTRGEANKTHGQSGTRLYGVWKKMRDRCNSPACKEYKHYGQRGIRVCARWDTSFAAFAADVGERPPGMTLEREDNDGDYEPGNVRWATRAEQTRNTARNVFFELDGQRKTLAEWARNFGIKVGTVRTRLKFGWEVKRAFTQPVGAAS